MDIESGVREGRFSLWSSISTFYLLSLFLAALWAKANNEITQCIIEFDENDGLFLPSLPGNLFQRGSERWNNVFTETCLLWTGHACMQRTGKCWNDRGNACSCGFSWYVFNIHSEPASLHCWNKSQRPLQTTKKLTSFRALFF